MDLSIIILNYKTTGLVKQCIKGIELLNLNLDFEIIVVDNDSEDGCTKMIKEEFPSQPKILNKKELQIKLNSTGKNLGFTAGNNLGIKQATGKYVMILNPDITVMPGSIEKMFDFMENQPEVGLVGPKLINPDGTFQFSCYRFPSWKIPIYRRTALGKLSFAKKKLKEYLMADWDHNSNREVDWLLGACLLARKKAIEDVGLMDERFFLYFSDVDWCCRFWQNKWKIYYLASAEMVHYHQRLSAEVPAIKSLFNKITRIHITDGIKYFAKYLGAKLPRS